MSKYDNRLLGSEDQSADSRSLKILEDHAVKKGGEPVKDTAKAAKD